MSEVKRPANTGSEMSDWAARANAYMDHLQSLIDAQVEKLKGRRLALDKLEAERDRLLRNAPAVMGWVSANVKDNGWADINKAMQMLEEKS